MAITTTLQDLAEMKREGRKSACIVAWDHPMAAIAQRAGVDLISVGDSVGVNLWGHHNPLEVTMEEMIVVGRAVRRGAPDTLMSIDFPFGPLQQGPDEAVRAAIRLAKEVGADLVKLDGAAAFPEAVQAVVRAGIPVWAQFGITPQTALAYGVDYASMATQGTSVPDEMATQLVDEARRLEEAGAALLNFTNSGPVVGPAVVEAVSIPVLGGFGGGPWLDGRIRMAHAAIGYSASMLDEPRTTYANVAQTTLQAFEAFLADVRGGRQIKGGRP
jgi:3-methyl-2-oxobutanoate hydroxymethyltransferase